MKPALSRRLAIVCAAFLMGVGSLVGPTNVARAADTNEVDRPYDARLDVYPPATSAMIKNCSAASTWLLFVMLGAVGLGFLFWDPARRNLE